jgi:microsomal dipeptidase-like Zn-dependent dipeptidase
VVTKPIDAAHLEQMTAALVDAGFDEAEDRKVIGENVPQLFRAAPPPD